MMDHGSNYSTRLRSTTPLSALFTTSRAFKALSLSSCPELPPPPPPVGPGFGVEFLLVVVLDVVELAVAVEVGCEKRTEA